MACQPAFGPSHAAAILFRTNLPALYALEHVFDAARALLAAIKRQRERRQTVDALRALSDWQLRDIGLCRADILSVAQGNGRNRRRLTAD